MLQLGVNTSHEACVFVDMHFMCVYVCVCTCTCYLFTHLCQPQTPCCCPTLLLPWWTPLAYSKCTLCVSFYVCNFLLCFKKNKHVYMQARVSLHVNACWYIRILCSSLCGHSCMCMWTHYRCACMCAQHESLYFIEGTCPLRLSIETDVGGGVRWLTEMVGGRGPCPLLVKRFVIQMLLPVSPTFFWTLFK